MLGRKIDLPMIIFFSLALLVLNLIIENVYYDRFYALFSIICMLYIVFKISKDGRTIEPTSIYLLYNLLSVFLSFLSVALYRPDQLFNEAYIKSIWIYVTFSGSMLVVYNCIKMYDISKRKINFIDIDLGSRQNKISLPMLKLVIFMILSITGSALVFRNIDSLGSIINDPFSSRSTIVGDTNGLSWIMFKMLYNVIGFSVVLFYYKRIGILIASIIIAASLFTMSLYGGRFLPFSAAIFVVLLINSYVKSISYKSIVLFGAMIFLFGIVYNGYRYTQLTQTNYDSRSFQASFERQTTGEVAELARSIELYDPPIAREHLVNEIIYKSIPDVAYKAIFNSSFKDKPDVTFGRYLTTLQFQDGRTEDGGLRVGLPGELFLAFGWYGVILVSIMFAVVFKRLDLMYKDGDKGVYMSSFIFVQIIFVSITGISNFIPALQYSLVTYIIVHIVHRASLKR